MTTALRHAVIATLVALWLGGAALFAGVVARAAFAVLPTRALAGLLVGRVLPVLFLAGILVGVVVLALAWNGSLALRLSAAVTALACAVAQIGIAPRIARLREAIGPSLDALPAGDPRRVEFGRLHAISVGWLGVAMLAAVIAVTFALLALRRPDAPVT